MVSRFGRGVRSADLKFQRPQIFGRTPTTPVWIPREQLREPADWRNIDVAPFPPSEASGSRSAWVSDMTKMRTPINQSDAHDRLGGRAAPRQRLQGPRRS